MGGCHLQGGNNGRVCSWLLKAFVGSWLSLLGVKGWPITLYGLCYWQSRPIFQPKRSVMLKELEMTSVTIVAGRAALWPAVFSPLALDPLLFTLNKLTTADVITYKCTIHFQYGKEWSLSSFFRSIKPWRSFYVGDDQGIEMNSKPHHQQIKVFSSSVPFTYGYYKSTESASYHFVMRLNKFVLRMRQ